MFVCVCFVYSAFDTLSKVFNPSDEGIEQRLANKSLQCVGGTTIHLIGRDQENPIIEVEGPLLTDSHVGFKVGEAVLLKKTSFSFVIHLSFLMSSFFPCVFLFLSS